MPNQEYRGIPIENKLLDGVGLSTVLGLIKDEIPTNVSELSNDVGYITSAEVTGQVQTDWAQEITSAVDYIKNKPSIPKVSASTALTTGITLGTVTVDGVTTTFYAPEAEEKPFIITVTKTYDEDEGTESISCDKTWEEIVEASNLGKKIEAVYVDVMHFDGADTL